MMGLIILLSLSIRHYFKRNKYLSDQIVILSDQVKKSESELSIVNWNNSATTTISQSNWINLERKLKNKLDSVTKANKIKAINTATVIAVNYHDTIKVEVTRDIPIKMNDSYIIPVSYNSQCWSLQGEIMSLDPGSTLSITERKGSNSIQLIVEKERRFLWWVRKKAQYRAFSDCGSLRIDNVIIKRDD